jgi:glycosyltransferase involved in cell wall biosynthesis
MDYRFYTVSSFRSPRLGENSAGRCHRAFGGGNPVTGESAHGPDSTIAGDVSANERRCNHDLLRANAALLLEHRHSVRTVNSPRVLWLSPGMRQLARVQAEALRRRGVDVLLVTSDQYFPKSDARDYELVLDPRFRRAATWPATLAAWRRVREYRPDVVIAELVSDPRWIALAGRAPRVQLVHDDRPHDPAEQRPAYKRAVFDRWGAGSAATVTCSDYVAAAVATQRDVAGTRVHVVPLCSDLDAALVPPFVGPEGRHDFVMIGRLNPYKNVDVVLEAWQRHVAGGGWRGDDLVFIGDGPAMARALPKHTRWRSGRYRYCDVVTTLAAAKGSIAHHRRASQSGVQVLSLQLGVMPIVSTAGGLPEFQPPGCPPVGVDDVAGLAAAFDELADPCTAALRGAAAARHYAQRFAVDWAADRLLNVITEVLAARSPGRSTAAPTAPTSRGAP